LRVLQEALLVMNISTGGRNHRLLVNRRLGVILKEMKNQDQTGSHPTDDCLLEA